MSFPYWSPYTSYTAGNIVTLVGQNFTALSNNLNSQPPSSNWVLYTGGDKIALQVVDGTSFPGGYSVQNTNLRTLYSSGASMSFTSPNVITFNTPGLYKITTNSGFANGETGNNPNTDFWAIIKNASGTPVFQETSTTGSGFNGSATQCFVNAQTNWTATFVFRSDIAFTYTSTFSPALNADITRIN